MKTVLKKAGIVVAAATAGLLAMSPLAFAGDYSGDSADHGSSHHDSDHHHKKKVSCEQDNSADNQGKQKGLVNVQNTNVQVPIQACNNSVVEGVLGILAKDQKNKDRHG